MCCDVLCCVVMCCVQIGAAGPDAAGPHMCHRQQPDPANPGLGRRRRRDRGARDGTPDFDIILDHLSIAVSSVSLSCQLRIALHTPCAVIFAAERERESLQFFRWGTGGLLIFVPGKKERKKRRERTFCNARTYNEGCRYRGSCVSKRSKIS